MASFSPLPSLRDLCQSFVAYPKGVEDLAKPWNVNGYACRWYARTSFAWRECADHLARCKNRRKLTIWLPDYFCNESTQPLRAGGHKLVFYPLTDRMIPDWITCQKIAHRKPPDLFVLVHYFGALSESVTARAFVESFDGLLIEDATHCMMHKKSIGDIGDIVSFSPYKHFAIPDGGILIAKKREHLPPDSLNPGRLETRWFFKRLFQTMLPAHLLEWRVRHLVDEFGRDPESETLGNTVGLSRLSVNMLGHYIRPSFLERFVAQRQDNFRLYTELFSDLPGAVETMAQSPAAPYRWWVRFGNEICAKQAFNNLRAVGCPVDTWPDLAPEVREMPEEHSGAIRLRETMVFFPVHQSIQSDRIHAWRLRLRRIGVT